MSFKEIFGRRVSVGAGDHIGVLQPEAIRLGTEEANSTVWLDESEGSVRGGIVATRQEGYDAFPWSKVGVFRLGLDAEGTMVPSRRVENGQLAVMGCKAE